MKKTSIITIIISIAVIITGYLVYKNQSHPVAENIVAPCNEVNIEDAYVKANEIESKLSSYSSKTKDVMGQSTEGGEQTDYMSNGKLILVKQTFFGETGKSEVYYYLEDGKIFYVKKENTEYLLPISEDPSVKTKSVEVKDFLLNQNQELCSWYKNKELQTNDSGTQDLVSYLVTGI